MEVALIGLGNMGSRIAQCILDGGFDLTVWIRTASKMEPLVAKGAKPSATAKAAVTGADVIVTSLRMTNPSGTPCGRPTAFWPA